MDKEIKNKSETSKVIGTEHFLRLLAANNKSIYAYIYSLIPNHFDTDDILQETVIYMFHNLSKFEPGSSFIKWAVRIAHYRVLSFYSRRKNAPLRFDTELLHLISEDAFEVVPEINQRLETLAECRKKLADPDQAMVSMRYDQGLAVKEISEKSDKSIHSIYRSIARIHDLLLLCVRRSTAQEDMA
ncbi:MAG: sigma-70 family RNA polymerase sigma factor [Phycisphaerae bacterium]|nr:sigma-70 family RNA polymerase sigma factor [Phycisphaerae bacterium]